MKKLRALFISLMAIFPAVSQAQTANLWSSWRDLNRTWLPSELVVVCRSELSRPYTYKITNRAGIDVRLFELKDGYWQRAGLVEITDSRLILEKTVRQLKISDISHLDRKRFL